MNLTRIRFESIPPHTIFAPDRKQAAEAEEHYEKIDELHAQGQSGKMYEFRLDDMVRISAPTMGFQRQDQGSPLVKSFC